MRIRNPQTGKTYYRKRRRRFDRDRIPRELTFTCFRRYRFLSRDRTRRWLVEAMAKHRKEWPIDIWACVAMPEHVHLLVAPRRGGVEVGRFAGRIKEEGARKGISWLEQHARRWLPRITVVEGQRTRRRFWQPGGGYDRNIDESRTLVSVINYVHANPVRRGLVERPEDWEWSSARW